MPRTQRSFLKILCALCGENRGKWRRQGACIGNCVTSESTTPAKPVVFGVHEPKTIAQLEDVASRAERAALMADGHLGYVMPIGGVAAYEDKVSVVGVGFDIACGNAAIRTDLRYTPALAELLPTLADEIQNVVSFGVGRKNRSSDAPVDHSLFESPSWDALPGHAKEGLRSKAR